MNNHHYFNGLYMIKKLIILFILLLFTSCASVPPTPNEFHFSQNYNKYLDIVWDEVIAIFAKRNIPIKNIEKFSGIIATEDMKVKFTGEVSPESQYCDCGKPGNLTTYREMVGRFNVFVRKVGKNETSVQINPYYRASKYFGNDFIEWTDCTSKGFLEHDILTQLDLYLSAKGGIGVEVTGNGTIQTIADGSPAKEAGLLIGDKVIEVNNIPMKDRQELANNIIGEPDTEVKIGVMRDNKKLEFILKRKIINFKKSTSVLE